MRLMACALLVSTLVAGCAGSRFDPSASPRTSPDDGKVACEMSGGKWNALTRFCDR
jgi:hypothetical protein